MTPFTSNMQIVGSVRQNSRNSVMKKPSEPIAQITAVVVCVVYSVLIAVPLALITGGRGRRRHAEWAIPDSNR